MARNTDKTAYLLLEDGTVFSGISMGKTGTAIGEVVFNTCTASYEDLLFDPTYYGQIVAQTYPLVGNRGVRETENNHKIMANGYIVREWCTLPNGGLSLHRYLEKNGVVGISGIDTRRLTRALRGKGYMKGAITDSLENKDALLKEISAYSIAGAVEAVTVSSPRQVSADGETSCRIAALDYGFPTATLQALTARGCAVTLLPASYTAEQVMALAPDGILLSDGPADPDDNPQYIREIQSLTAKDIPILAIGLGHQMLALAVGGEIEKMPQGHRGSNQPVFYTESDKKKLMITNQNHGYAVKDGTLNHAVADIVMRNVNDGTIEGCFYKSFPALSVQFTPNGDADSSTSWIFDWFVEKCGEGKK